MSDQDWIIADLNKHRLVQGEQMAELREEIRGLSDKAAILKKENLFLRATVETNIKKTVELTKGALADWVSQQRLLDDDGKLAHSHIFPDLAHSMRELPLAVLTDENGCLVEYADTSKFRPYEAFPGSEDEK